MKLFILSGDREAGKTTFCRTLRGVAQREKRTVAGLITLTERDKELRALNLSTEEQRILAEANPLWNRENFSAHQPDGSVKTGRWIFREETLQWGNSFLADRKAADLYILDEAGILELERDQGWTEGIRRADRRIDRCAVIVVRPELTETALKRWPEADILTIDPERRPQEEDLITRILQNC